MANRIKPRNQYVVAVEALGDNCYRFFTKSGYWFWSFFQSEAEHFDSLRDAERVARLIPGAFVATVLADHHS